MGSDPGATLLPNYTTLWDTTQRSLLSPNFIVRRDNFNYEIL